MCSSDLSHFQIVCTVRERSGPPSDDKCVSDHCYCAIFTSQPSAAPESNNATEHKWLFLCVGYLIRFQPSLILSRCVLGLIQ